MRAVVTRSRVRRALLLTFGVLAVVVVTWTVIAALKAASDLRAVRADVHRLTSGPTPDRTTLERALARDLHKAESARSLTSGVGPTIFGWVPILGRNITAERAVADASVQALRAGLTLSRVTKGLSTGHGGVDLERVRAAADALDATAVSLRPALRELRQQPVGWTLPPVGTGVRQARNQLLALGPEVTRAAAGLHALVGVLGGSGKRTITVVLMNNAELRGAGGLPSAYATGTVDNGALSLTPFQDVNTVAQPPATAVRVPAPPSYHEAYGPFLADTTLWKNTTMAADDPQTAQVLAAVSAVSLKVHPDVVVLCDVPAAAEVISATGPVEINGEPVTGDELTRRLMVDAYGNGSLSQDKQIARRKALDAAATEAFKRIKQDASATPALLKALVRAVDGRHLAVWSARPDEERGLVTAGIAGTTQAGGTDIAMAVANNLGDSPSTGNKLDYYVHRSMSVDVRLHATVAYVTQTLTLRNAAPAGLGPYVAGVKHPGDLSELVSMQVAASATLTSFTRDGVDAAVERTSADGGLRLTTELSLARGSSTTYRVTYSVPVRHGRYQLALLPQPLAAAATLHLHIRAIDADLGVVTGYSQPVGGVIDHTGPWDSAAYLTVPVHAYTGPKAWWHSFAHFWTHKV
ncbi:MAG: DUF4012 domain-containing protein [Frankiaceae bacterium]|nr:DUF4012 domain-containing protein [Frankiaceae bacterium]MBV9368216.1 DUF4012 domain-containing protein [Frankiales bacterium]